MFGAMLHDNRPAPPSPARASAPAEARGVSGDAAPGDDAPASDGPEYDAEGLYVHGPRRAKPSGLLALMAEVSAPGALTPAVARGQMRERRRRAERRLTPPEKLLAALAGAPMRVRGLRDRRTADRRVA